MHLCCTHCVEDATAAIGKSKGTRSEVNRKDNSITISATDGTSIQTALDTLAAAGFHGETDNENIAMKDDSGVQKGNVERLELTGIHNCCRGCNRAAKKAIASVKGVTADTAEPRQRSLVVEGNFDGSALIKALFHAGFHVKAKQ